METSTKVKKIKKKVDLDEHLFLWYQKEFDGASVSWMAGLLFQKLKDAYENPDSVITEPPTPLHMAERAAEELKEELDEGIHNEAYSDPEE